MKTVWFTIENIIVSYRNCGKLEMIAGGQWFFFFKRTQRKCSNWLKKIKLFKYKRCCQIWQKKLGIASRDFGSLLWLHTELTACRRAGWEVGKGRLSPEHSSRISWPAILSPTDPCNWWVDTCRRWFETRDKLNVIEVMHFSSALKVVILPPRLVDTDVQQKSCKCLWTR